jgi:predicted phosphoribosyltransferase
MVFDDRAHAGRELAKKLTDYAGRDDVRLFALPRGGIVVGAEVAKALKIHLDLIVTRKIGAPENEEYALGALAETGEVVWNETDRRDDPAVRRVIADEEKEAARRIKTYRDGRALPDLQGKTAVIIDDGVATGATMRAAVAAARHQQAKRVIIAVPHGAKDSLTVLRREADEVVALDEPEWYGSVGQFYQDFPQTEDAEVLDIMKQYGPK